MRFMHRSITCNRSGITSRSSSAGCFRHNSARGICVAATSRHRGRGKPSRAGGFWLLAGGWCVFFFSCSGSKLPTYILPAYPFLCLALGEFVARTKWNTAFRTRVLVGAMAALLLYVNYVGMPWYAKERSPYDGNPEMVERFVNDPDTAVVCFPRNCDSLAFYSDAPTMQSVRTKNANQLIMDCHHRRAR